jgi:hypothetical protein
MDIDRAIEQSTLDESHFPNDDDSYSFASDVDTGHIPNFAAIESEPPIRISFPGKSARSTYMEYMGMKMGELAKKHKFSKSAREDIVKLINEIIQHICPGKL